MNPIELFHNLVNLAAADAKFTDEEIDFLVDHANKYNIPSEEFDTAIAGIREGVVEVAIPDTHDDRVMLLKEMIKLMVVDGEMDEMEKVLCAQASAQMDFTSGQFNEILNEVLGEPQF